MPVNWRTLDASNEAIARDVEYAMKIGGEYADLLLLHFENLNDLRTLELGPGHNFGASFLLACLGAEACVADRFPAPWQSDYHPAFYRLLGERIISRWPWAPFRQLAFIGSEQQVGNMVKVVPAAAEALSGIASGTVDAVLSNAVLEHLSNPPLAVRELHRVTRDGGVGLHQVDFRDHRDFSRPLEYLLLDDVEFEGMFADRNGECGRQMRHLDLDSLFRQARFNVLKFDANWLADERYLDGFIPRLRASSSRYREMSRDDLRVLSGHFTLHKPTQSHP